ncbi:MAG: ABC transporter permease [Lachnospiraceae bacterium]
MNTPKRSLLYVIRKRSRTLLLFVILLAVSTLVLSGLSIMDAASDSSAELRESTGASFTIKPNYETGTRSGTDSSYLMTQEQINEGTVNEIMKIDGVKAYNAKLQEILSLQAVNSDYLETVVYNNWSDSDILKYNSLVFGSINTNYDSFFTSDQFQLTQGHHISVEDKNVVIISNDLASKHNLQIGDKIRLSVSDYMAEAIKADDPSANISANSAEAEIIGLFDILTEQSDKETLGQHELYDNYIYTDISTIKNVVSTTQELTELFEEGYGSVDFFVNDPAQLSNIMSQVSNISSINWDNFTLTANDEVYQASSSSMSNVEKLITTMIVVVVIIAAAIVTLILSMWVRSRVRETGILMSTGIAKYKIVAQFVLETVLIAVFAFALSYFASNAIAGNLGHIIDSTIATGDVQVAMSSFIFVCCAGIAVILAAIGISSIPVMRMKPREILSKMS